MLKVESKPLNLAAILAAEARNGGLRDLDTVDFQEVLDLGIAGIPRPKGEHGVALALQLPGKLRRSDELERSLIKCRGRNRR